LCARSYSPSEYSSSKGLLRFRHKNSYLGTAQSSLVFRCYGMQKAEIMPNAGFSTAIEEIVKSRSANAVNTQK